MRVTTQPLLSLSDEVLQSGRIALLCNQTSWDFTEGRYLFELLHERGTLKRVFIPEHGLFAELQDQEALNSGKVYECLGLDGVDFVSLYGSSEASLAAPLDKLTDLDAIIIDLQDVGCRYYTFISTVDRLFRTLAEHKLNLTVYVLDRPNPAGRQVEGTPLSKTYSSFIGVEGLVHRHGLTFGELCYLLSGRYNARFTLNIVPYTVDPSYQPRLHIPAVGSIPSKTPCSIYPSPNIPTPQACLLYSGQCLFEGTNVSEGRGTTRPFEIFGAPFLQLLHLYNTGKGLKSWNEQAHPLRSNGAKLRMLHFIPTFHKHKGEKCVGFQLHLTGAPYHSLEHSMRIIRFLSENVAEFAWREGTYEKGNDRIAIELLAGDPVLLSYLKGNTPYRQLLDTLKEAELAWINHAAAYTIYPEPLYRVEC